MSQSAPPYTSAPAMRIVGAPRAGAARRFEGGFASRLTANWGMRNSAIEDDLRAALPGLRARSRELCKNNPWAAGWLSSVESNLAGTGARLQCQPRDGRGQLDNRAADDIEAAWRDWSEACDLRGRWRFADIERLIVRALARDGEALVRLRRADSAPYGLALELLDAERLDITYDRADRGQNPILMGVEMDLSGRPVAYHLSLRLGQPGQRERVPADEILHLFRPEYPEQTRGVPWLYAVMDRLRWLEQYEDAALIAAQVGAAKMGFFTSPGGEAPLSGAKAPDGSLHIDSEAGSFHTLPEGVTFQGWDPSYPDRDHGDFVTAMLRGAAAGVGVSYSTLGADLSDANYSSLRAGLLAERDQWMVQQDWLLGAFHRPIFLSWLDAAAASGALLVRGRPVSAAQSLRYRPHRWQARRWQWVDPAKEISATTESIAAGLKSHTQAMAEQGIDLEETWHQLERERQLAERLGLVFSLANQPRPTTSGAPNDADPNTP